MTDPQPSLKQRWRSYRGRLKRRYPAIRNYVVITTLVFGFMIVFFWPYLVNRVFVALKPGEAGVMWERFFGGTNMDYIYREGFQIVMPWNRMHIYNMRLQQTPHSIIALCKNGLPVEIEVSIRSRPRSNTLPNLHTVVGPDYIETVVKPEIQAHVRAVVSQFEPQELYTSEGYILNLILQGAMGKISERFISLDDLLIKRIILPEKVSEAIESKLVQEQLVFEAEFQVEREKREAMRKEIEAGGILEFQKKVASGGSFRDYLRFAGIQATVQLAQSPNSKMVVIGGADGGLPLILNTPQDSFGPLDAVTPATDESADGTTDEFKGTKFDETQDLPPIRLPTAPIQLAPSP